MNELTTGGGPFWVSIVALLIGLYGALRERRKATQEEKDSLLRPVWERIVAAEDEHKTFKTGVEDTFKNQVVYRRDFQDYKDDQKNTLKGMEEGLRRDFSEMKGMLNTITEMLMKKASK